MLGLACLQVLCITQLAGNRLSPNKKLVDFEDIVSTLDQ